MPDRIGIIGNTQGVNASNRPAPKNISRVSQVLPLASAAAISSCSEICCVLSMLCCALAAAAAMDEAAGRVTVTVCVCGG